mgnify:CR=1 FL=1
MDDAMQGQGETARKVPTHELTYARLRDMILFGRLEPGQAVTIQGLVRDLDAGMTPVREAIRRLTAEGALLPQGNRRVTVLIESRTADLEPEPGPTTIPADDPIRSILPVDAQG